MIKRPAIAVLASLLLFPGVASAEAAPLEPDEWGVRAPMPSPREALAAASAADGRIFTFGGLTPEPWTGGAEAVFAYSPSRGTWDRHADLPTPRSHLAATTGTDGLLYTVGGYADPTTPDGMFSVTGAFEAYDPETDRWTALPSLPSARLDPAAVTAADGRIVVIGGYDGTTSGAVDIYDPATGQWSSGAPMPFARQQHAAAAGDDGRIYVAGGRSLTGGGFATGTLQIYDPRTDTWSAGPDMTHARYAASAVAAEGRIYVMGGGMFFTETTVEAYDPPSDAWSLVAPMPTPRFFFGAALGVDGLIYTAGGYEMSSGWHRTLEVYRPLPGAAPSLPSAPGNLATTPGSPTGTVRITWDTPEAVTPVSSYTIYRGADPAGLEPVGTVDGAVTAFTDTGLAKRAGSSAYYAVSATNVAGEGPPSEAVCSSTKRVDKTACGG